MQSRTSRYCRYHEVPQRKPFPGIVRSLLQSLSHFSRRSMQSEGRKRIIPGYENTNLGSGWNIVYPGQKGGDTV